MTLPLWTNVTDRRLCFTAYSIANRMSRFVAVALIGLMPTDESGRTALFSFFARSALRKLMSCFASGEPFFHSSSE